jgi:hypothetical protein
MLEEVRNTELFIDYTRQTTRRGLASIANLRESAGLDIGVSLNVPHALMAHTARWLPVLKAALEEYGFQKNGKEGKGRVIVEMTERDIPNLRLPQVREGIRELLEDESGILLAFDDVDDTNALTGLLKMAGEYITPHIIKVNGDIVKAVKEGNMEPARDTIRTAIKEGIGTIIFEDIEDQYVFTRLIQLVSSNPEIRMLFQGNYLGKKQPIEDITA